MERSEKFYFDPLMEFQVDGKLFCVPREGFMQSSTFVDLYKITTHIKEEKPVATSIDDVTAEEFTAFLKLLIRQALGLEEHELCEAELESALKLSSLWKFHAVRKSAISRLEALSLEPSRIIQLAHLYDVDSWVAPGIERLAFRAQSLTFKEAEQVGLETLVEIYMHRDTLSHFYTEMIRDNITDADKTWVRELISADVKKLRVSAENTESEANTTSCVVKDDATSFSDAEQFIEVEDALSEPVVLASVSSPKSPKSWEQLEIKIAEFTAAHEDQLATLYKQRDEAIAAAEADRKKQEEEAALVAAQLACEEEERKQRFAHAYAEKVRREGEAAAAEEQRRLADAAAAAAEEAMIRADAKKAEEQVKRAQAELVDAETSLAALRNSKPGKKKMSESSRQFAERNVSEAETKLKSARVEQERAEKALQKYDLVKSAPSSRPTSVPPSPKVAENLFKAFGAPIPISNQPPTTPFGFGAYAVQSEGNAVPPAPPSSGFGFSSFANKGKSGGWGF